MTTPVRPLHAPSIDLQRGPNVQIRDSQVVVRTRSLLETGNEVVPEELVRDLLKEQWIPTEATGPTPIIYVQDEVIQGDRSRHDFVIVSADLMSSSWAGHRHEFVDTDTPIILNLHTIHSRQRLYNLMGECRRIIGKWILALDPYHSLDFEGFQPEYNGPKNYEGTAHLRLKQGALPLFYRRNTGQETSSTDPLGSPAAVNPPLLP